MLNEPPEVLSHIVFVYEERLISVYIDEVQFVEKVTFKERDFKMLLKERIAKIVVEGIEGDYIEIIESN